MLKYGILGVTAAVLAFLLTPWVAELARRVGAVDEPNERRVHDGRIPSLGGVAVLVAFLGALAVGCLADQYLADAFQEGGAAWGWLLGGALIVMACGTADDVWMLGPVPKLLCETVAGVLVVAAGHGISTVTNPLSGNSIDLGWLGVPLTLLWVVGVTNAFNLIDGLDGLAAGVALIACGTLFAVSLVGVHVAAASLAVALGGSLAGFLYHNFNPATAFLGDSGSLLLGYLLSVMSMQASLEGATAVVLVVPILALGLPIMDTALAMLRRVLGVLHVARWDGDRNEYRFLVLGSASIFRADRDHIHHRLLRMGLTHRRSVLLLYAVCIALGLMAFLAVSARGTELAILVALVATASYLGVRKLAYREVEVLKRGTLLPLFQLPVLSRRGFHALADAGFIAVAYASSQLLLRSSFVDPAIRVQILYGAIAAVAVKLAVFFYAGIYRRTYRYTNAADLLALGKALVAAQIAASGVVAALYGLPPMAAAAVLLDFYLSATLVIGSRVSFLVLELIAGDQPRGETRRVLIYGAGSSGTALLREIHQNPSLGYHAVGFVDDLPSLRGVRVNGLEILGGGDDLSEILERAAARELIVASPKIDDARIQAVAATCLAHGVELRRFRMALDEMSAPPRDEAPTPRRAVGS